MNRWKVQFWNGHQIKAVVVMAYTKEDAIQQGQQTFSPTMGWAFDGAYTL